MQKPDSIRKYRTANNIKQEAAAKYLGIRQQSYSDIERNLTCLDRETAEKLARLFNVSLHDIYYEPDNTPPAATDTEKELLQQLLTEKDKLLHEKDMHLHEKDKRIALLEQMLKEREKKNK